MLLSLPACVKFEPQSCPKNLVSREIPSSRMRKVTRVFVQSQSFNPCNSIVHRIRRADFAREFCFFCRNFRENRRANWDFAATGMEFQLQQPIRFRLWRVAENGNHSCARSSLSLTRSRPCQARWLLTPHLRVCAGLRKVSTYEPYDQSKVDTGEAVVQRSQHHL